MRSVEGGSPFFTDSIDYTVVRKWNQERRLLKDPRKVAAKVSLPILVPQVLIDGVPVGTYEDLIDLEDDADLGEFTLTLPLGRKERCRLYSCKGSLS